MMNLYSKRGILDSNDELCIKHEELCVNNDEFCSPLRAALSRRSSARVWPSQRSEALSSDFILEARREAFALLKREANEERGKERALCLSLHCIFTLRLLCFPSFESQCSLQSQCSVTMFSHNVQSQCSLQWPGQSLGRTSQTWR